MPSLFISYRHFVLGFVLALIAAVHVIAPKAAFELELVFGLAAVLAPSVKALGARLGGHRGIAVILICGLVLTALVLISIFVVPPAALSLRAMLVGLKDQIPALRQVLEDWIAGLGDFTAGFDLDEGLQKVLEIIQTQGIGAAAVALAGKISIGFVFGVVQTFIGFVMLAILAATWDEFVTWVHKLVRNLAPAQSTRVLRIAEHAQTNGIALVRGLGTMALIFIASYVVILLFIGMPIGKIAVFALLLGTFSALPAVGGFISAALAITIALTHFGVYGWQGWVLTGAGIAAHFIETKFLTPKIVGHAIDVPPFVMIGTLLCGVSMNGAAGVFQALMLLPVLRAMIDDVVIGPHNTATPNVGSGGAQSIMVEQSRPAQPSQLRPVEYSGGNKQPQNRSSTKKKQRR